MRHASRWGATLGVYSLFIEEAKVWQRRHGGNLIKLYPYVVSARESLNKRLHLMSDYLQKARKMAAILNNIENVFTKPQIPQTNMFHVYLKAQKESIEQNALEIAKNQKVWLFSEVKQMGPFCSLELSVGDASLQIQNNELKEFICQLSR